MSEHRPSRLSTPYEDRIAHAKAEREAIQARYPDEFNEGARRAMESVAIYPSGFEKWDLDRRNAFFAGFNLGLLDRKRIFGG